MNITQNGELTTCDAQNSSQVISDCVDPAWMDSYESESNFALAIELQNDNFFRIDDIYIKDESGTIYEVGMFCKTLPADTDPNDITECDSFDNLYKLNVLSICDPDDPTQICNTNSLLSLELSPSHDTGTDKGKLE